MKNVRRRNAERESGKNKISEQRWRMRCRRGVRSWIPGPGSESIPGPGPGPGRIRSFPGAFPAVKLAYNQHFTQQFSRQAAVSVSQPLHRQPLPGLTWAACRSPGPRMVFAAALLPLCFPGLVRALYERRNADPRPSLPFLIPTIPVCIYSPFDLHKLERQVTYIILFNK